MDKLNSGFFNSSISSFDSLNFKFQTKLVVHVPNQTKITGKFKFQLIDLNTKNTFLIKSII